MQPTAYAYLRVSGKGQVDGHGFDRQLETIQTYARKSGTDILKIFREEGISGTAGESDRPAFQDMVSDLLRNGTRTVFVEGLDRLAREYRIQETLLIYLASKGIDLVSARTEESVTAAIEADPMKKALVQMQGVFSELEKSLLVKKLRVARERIRKERGKCEGRPGYRELAPDVLREIRKLRRRRRDGRKTFQQITDELNHRGLLTVTGKPFTAGNVRSILHRLK